MTYQSVHAYFSAQAVLPTYGGFKSAEDLQLHALRRRQLLQDKLFLPVRLFQNARLIEFGPDSGENALVFAQWGAHCTLVEPNPKALPVIRDYFEHYQLLPQLADLIGMDVVAFAQQNRPAQKYDLVVAEGFIYQVRPEQLWIDFFARLLADDGFVLLNYLESFGMFIELLTRAVHAHVRRLTGLSALEAGRALYATKWDTIPHTRAFEAWVMDVLENPFMRLAYCLETNAFWAQMRQAGFALYSSWPSCKHALQVYWHKRELTPEAHACSQAGVVAQNRLSYLFGKSLFLKEPAPEALFWDLLRLTDHLIDQFDDAAAGRLLDCLAAVQALLQSGVIYAEPADLAQASRTAQSVAALVTLLRQGMPEAIIHFCNHDPAFINAWGMPYHFAVFAR